MSELKQNVVTSDMNLKNLLDLFKKDLMLNFNCHALATVQSFDSSNGTVKASINYKKTFMQRQGNGSYQPIQKDYPLLVDCPVIMMQGGTAVLTFPITPGDSCMILFNDRDMDNWLYSGQVQEVASQRLHSFSDGVALVGLRSFNSPVEDYDSVRAVLRNGGAQVAVGPTLLKLSNQVTDLKQVINGLIDIIATLTSAMSGANAGNIPATVAAPSAAATTALNLYKNTAVGALLE